jgi:hypothetical protein
MADTDHRPTLSFAASFPQDAHFAPTAGDLAARLAVSAGVGDEDARAIGRSVEAAFTRALATESAVFAPAIDVSLNAGQHTIDLSVSCGASTTL